MMPVAKASLELPPINPEFPGQRLEDELSDALYLVRMVRLAAACSQIPGAIEDEDLHAVQAVCEDALRILERACLYVRKHYD